MSSSIDLAALEARLRQHVAALARTPRTPGSPEHRQAAGYIRQHLEQTGFMVVGAQVDEPGSAAVNLLTQPLPDQAGLPLFIVGAHYDSIPNSPGADDNASGVAALLELAHLILPYLHDSGPWAALLQLAAYDLEEYGLLGSYTHSQELQLKQTPVRGMISLEMLA